MRHRVSIVIISRAQAVFTALRQRVCAVVSGIYWCTVWGCCSMGDPPSEPPPAKKAKVPVLSGERFAAPLSPSAMDAVCKGFVPKNTKKSTNWAMRVFKQWRDSRNSTVAERCPEMLLEQPNAELLNYWLARFVGWC